MLDALYKLLKQLTKILFLVSGLAWLWQSLAPLLLRPYTKSLVSGLNWYEPLCPFWGTGGEDIGANQNRLLVIGERTNANLERRFAVACDAFFGSLTVLVNDKLRDVSQRIFDFIGACQATGIAITDAPAAGLRDCAISGDGWLEKGYDSASRPGFVWFSQGGMLPLVWPRSVALCSAALCSATPRSAALGGAKSELGRSSIVVSNDRVQGSVGTTWLTAIPVGGH